MTKSHNYSLQVGSPCINKGTPDTTGLNIPTTDLAGNPRIYNNRIDIGAYEYQGNNEIFSYSEQNYNVQIYPNPFNCQTNIQFNEKIKNAEINIYNSYGQKVKTIRNISGQKIELNRDNLSSGLYLIRLTEDKKIIITNKIIITD